MASVDADPTQAAGPDVLGAAKRPGLVSRTWQRVSGVVYPILTLVVCLLLIELAVIIFDIARYVIPPPSAVFATLLSRWDYLLENSVPTVTIMMAGFALSVAIGVPLAVLIASSRLVEKFVYPLVVTSQTVPKIALAPMLVIWFGFGLTPKILVAFLVAFFPIVINTVVGLRSVPTEMLDLARSMRASGRAVFWKIRFPYALPNIFAGLKVAITLAVIGAIVGEFVGADQGLGYVLIIASGRLQSDVMFAAVTFLVVIGMGAFFAMHVIERLAIPWHESVRTENVGGGTGG